MVQKIQGRNKELKRLAIISSYDESCGNAYFTDVLISSINSLDRGIIATPVGLNLRLTQNIGTLEQKAAERHIEQIAAFVAEFDSVNIQFESQLFGIIPSDVKKRLVKLVQANPNTFVTYHSPRVIGNFRNRKNAIRKLLTLNVLGAFKSELRNYRSNFDVYLNRAILKNLKKTNVPIVVHTRRSEQNIRDLFNIDEVHTHPLQFSARQEFSPEAYQAFRQRIGVSEEVKLVGLFGYLSKYKGHLDAIKALEALPKEVHFVVAGRQHPQSLGNKDAEKYIKALVTAIQKNSGLAGRVHFIGELANDEFETAVANVDCCLLPYHEVGQDGSGIASICFELGQRVLCSNSLAFDELFKLIPEYRSERFDLGNTVELAEKIQLILKESAKNKVSTFFTLKTQAELYVKLARG